MVSIYENERVVKTLLNVIEWNIKLLKEPEVSIEDTIGRVSAFIRFISRSEDSNELRFLQVLTNTIPSIYVSGIHELENMKSGKSEKEMQEIDGKITKVKEKSKEIFLETLNGLKDALTAEKDRKTKIIKCIEKAYVSMDKEITPIYRGV